MLYDVYQAQTALAAPLRAMARATARRLHDLQPDDTGRSPLRYLTAMCELVARAHLTHERPPFGIDSVTIGRRRVAVREEIATSTAFSTLLHFAKETATPGPQVLLVAPLSGHFATLLRNTVRTLLTDFDVYLTDWHNARDVPLEEGRFGFDEYVDDVIHALTRLGPQTHVVAVCQPCVPALAALAVMAQGSSVPPARSATLMAGPIDARVNPTSVNDLAVSRPIGWFERNVVATVPRPFAGAGRRVYPGFLQVSAFVQMNLDRHVRSHYELFFDLANGDLAAADAKKVFYDEYFAVLDIAAEFYLETVEKVFQEFQLARGVLEHRGRRVEPEAIRRMTLLTVEGERDDICAVGQTLAAHDLCTGIRAVRKRHHLQAGVGHYGVFSGRRWETQIYPILRNVVQSSE
jgi:poly(3-hydroxybutyrate) depolymerase